MNKSIMLFGIHCHQPVDNFHSVVDRAVERVYKPFIDVVKNYDFKFSIHFSGWLFEYIKEHSKELFKNLQDLSARGSVEFFTGGYYEPILASIPSDDVKRQIEKLNGFIKENFGQTPKGLWLTERVYDESIVEDLVNVGIEYVMLDDYHFLSAGFKKSELNGYFITEKGGNKLSIYPINKDLRYMIPFKEAEDVTAYLKKFKDEDVAIIFDDGEKFGIWPKTYDWVYNHKWLEKFLSSQTGSIETMTFREHINSFKPKGIAYLPSCSYYEMGEWSLKSENYFKIQEIREQFKDIDQYLRGGIWKNFFVKYEESNRLHKRMLEMSKKRAKKSNRQFMENLFKLQCNDAYWHGVFGGIYLPNLRDNAYRFLINCENEICKRKTTKTEITDNSFDGYKKAKLASPEIIAVFDEKYAGQMVEFDLRDRAFNIQNTLTRREEFYHKSIIRDSASKSQSGIDTIHELKNNDIQKWKDKIYYDWYIKNSFIDHIVDDSINTESFERCSFKEYGDFANQPFKIISKKPLTFEREGGFYFDKKYSTNLKKSFSLKNGTLYFNIQIKSEFMWEFAYLLEFNFHFANIDNIKINNKKANAAREGREFIKSVKIADEYTQKILNINFENRFILMSYPLNTVSQSEGGLNYNNQGITIGALFSLSGKLNEINGYIDTISMSEG